MDLVNWGVMHPKYIKLITPNMYNIIFLRLLHYFVPI